MASTAAINFQRGSVHLPHIPLSCEPSPLHRKDPGVSHVAHEFRDRSDNSANNPLNPDPTQVVRFGAASETEMMSGWVEYVDKPPASLSARLPQK